MDDKLLKAFAKCAPKDKKEKNLQRLIYNSGTTTLGGSKRQIEWLDIELPVNQLETDRVDLIGRCGDEYILCELKYSKGSSINTPGYAADEVKRYHKQILSNYEWLAKNGIHHQNAKSFNWNELAKGKTRLIVVANASYWAYWLGHRGELIPDGVDCYSIDIPADFVERNGDMKTINITKWDVL